MPQTVEAPTLRYRNRSYGNAQSVLAALRSLHRGGTTKMIQEAMDDPLSYNSVQSALWHLHDVGVADFELLSEVRWWSQA